MNTIPSAQYELSPRQSLSSELAGILARQIDNGEYAVGDSLPSELSLAESFSVSRTVVREALVRLKQQGRIRSRRGRAAVVTDSHEHVPDHTFAFQELSGDKYLAFNTFRLIVEGESAAFAAVHATEEQIVEMFSLCDAIESEMREGRSGVEPDFRFHCLVGAANGNEYLRDLVNAIAIKIWLGVHQGRFRSNLDEIYIRDVCEEHRDIVRAVAARDLHKARLAARQHLLNSALRQGVSIDANLLLFS